MTRCAPTTPRPSWEPPRSTAANIATGVSCAILGGDELELGEFPPRLGQWGLQAALYHAGLRFLELELADALYEEPNDWSLCRRMLAAGVGFGMIDDVVVDKYEGRRAAAEWRAGQVPEIE